MSKHRKNHKQKVAAFKQRELQKKRQIEKMQELFAEQVQKYQQTSRVEFMLETLMNNKPEMVTNQKGEYTINTDKVEEKDGKLVWKADGVSIFKDFVHEDEHYIFTMEHTNNLLSSVSAKIQQRLMEQASKAYDEAVKNGTVDTFFQTQFNKEGDLQDLQEAAVEEVSEEK
jgi:hypothetical protein